MSLTNAHGPLYADTGSSTQQVDQKPIKSLKWLPPFSTAIKVVHDIHFCR